MALQKCFQKTRLVSCPRFHCESNTKRMYTNENEENFSCSSLSSRFLLMHNPHCFNGYFIVIYFKYAFFNNSFLNS